jgi:diacylglycerol kinase family enzyme
MRIFQMIPHFLRGTQAAQPEIKVGQAERITIQGEDGPLPAQTDGEIICVDGSHLEIELLPLQIDVVVLGPGK